MNYLIVFIGAGIGGALRHAVNLLAARFLGVGFPWGTLAVNLVGGFIMGLLAAWFALRVDASQGLRLFLLTGILGGFTTFSAFSLDVAVLAERGQVALSAVYVVASVAGSIAALFAGLAIVRAAAG